MSFTIKVSDSHCEWQFDLDLDGGHSILDIVEAVTETLECNVIREELMASPTADKLEELILAKHRGENVTDEQLADSILSRGGF